MEFADGQVLRDRATGRGSTRPDRRRRRGPRDGARRGCTAGPGRGRGWPTSGGRRATSTSAAHAGPPAGRLAQPRPARAGRARRAARRAGARSSRADAIVHGDYRLDNVVVDPARAESVAVLDWEMATLGDPLADLASAVVWWDGVSGLDLPVAAVPADVPGLAGRRGAGRGVRRQGSGLDLGSMPWYVGFAFFKIAAIFEGIHYRSQQGLTVGEGFDRLGPSSRRWWSGGTRPCPIPVRSPCAGHLHTRQGRQAERSPAAPARVQRVLRRQALSGPTMARIRLSGLAPGAAGLPAGLRPGVPPLRTTGCRAAVRPPSSRSP